MRILCNILILILFSSFSYGQMTVTAKRVNTDSVYTFSKTGGVRTLLMVGTNYYGTADSSKKSAVSDSLKGVDTSKIIWSNRASQTIGGKIEIKDTLKSVYAGSGSYLFKTYREPNPALPTILASTHWLTLGGYDSSNSLLESYGKLYFLSSYGFISSLGIFDISSTTSMSLTSKHIGWASNLLNIATSPMMGSWYRFYTRNERLNNSVFIGDSAAFKSYYGVPHAKLFVVRLGLTNYETADNINAIQASITSTNTDTSKTTQSGIWAFAQDDTGTLLSTANKYIGGSFGTYKYSTHVSPFATGVQSQIGFGASGGAINNVWGFNSKVENSRSSDATINYGAAYHVDKSWSDTTAGTNRYAFWDESTLPSIFGGTVTAPTFIGALTGTASGNLVPADSNSIRNYSNSLYLKNADSTTLKNSVLSQTLKNADSTTIKNSLKGNAQTWTGAQTFGTLTASSSSVNPIFTRTTTGTNTYVTGMAIKAKTSGNMADGFGSFLNFQIEDDAGVANYVGGVGMVRSGADNTSDLVLVPYSAGTGNIRVYVKSDGNVGIGTATADSQLTTTGGINTRGINVRGSMTVAGTINGYKQFIPFSYSDTLQTGDSLQITIPTVTGFSYDHVVFNGWIADSTGSGNVAIRRVSSNITFSSNHAGDTGKRIYYTIWYKGN